MAKCIDADEEDVDAMEVCRDAKAHQKLHHERYTYDNRDIKAFVSLVIGHCLDRNSRFMLVIGHRLDLSPTKNMKKVIIWLFMNNRVNRVDKSITLLGV
jgi:hypothetical protein